MRWHVMKDAWILSDTSKSFLCGFFFENVGSTLLVGSASPSLEVKGRQRDTFPQKSLHTNSMEASVALAELAVLHMNPP